MLSRRDAIRRRVQELMDREQIYNPDELFFRVHRDFRTHYSVIREEIHNAKAALTVNIKQEAV